MPQQRQSPRTPLHLKPTEANSIRSPKLENRSPRSPLHEQRKKKGSRVADLEAKLGHAQEELEKLKEQLASALKELEETKKDLPASPLKTEVLDPVDEENEKTVNIEEEKVDPVEILLMEKDEFLPAEEDSLNCSTNDVFEGASAISDGEESRVEEEDAEGTETKVVTEEENCKDEMGAAEKERQVISVLAENQTLTKEANNAREKAEQMETKLAEAEEQLNNAKMIAEELREKLELEEVAKTSMEAEMRRLSVQTEQWRKAAEAAASVLVAGDGLVNGRRLGESGRSMEKHLRGCEFSMGGGGWSPGIGGGEVAEGNGGGKRRSGGGGIRAFGELWKKKSHLK